MSGPRNDRMMPAAGAEQSFAATLAAVMRAGLNDLDDAARRTAVESVLRFSTGDGGFRGRRGDADLYYATFAVRALHALDALAPEVARRVADWAATQRLKDCIDVMNLLTVRSLAGVALEADEPLTLVETMRATDGGYAKRPGAAHSSAYHTFLAVTAYDLAGRSVPRADVVRTLMAARQREDGGFAELPAMRRGSTNPTAGGIVVAILLNGLSEDVRAGVCRFYQQTQRPDGGWPATQLTPVSDLMSTATALVGLAQVGALDAPVLQRAAAFAQRCRHADGYGAVPEDPQSDVEYMFYGLVIKSLELGWVNQHE